MKDSAKLTEIQEPSDLVVRFEFEHGGYLIPESARFMDRGLDFCLEVFDFQATPVSEVQTRYRPEPVVQKIFDHGSMIESLIGSDQMDCFAVERLKVKDQVELGGRSFSVNIVTDGTCTVSDQHGEAQLRQYDRFLCPHGLDSIQISTTSGTQILRCFPPVV